MGEAEGYILEGGKWGGWGKDQWRSPLPDQEPHVGPHNPKKMILILQQPKDQTAIAGLLSLHRGRRQMFTSPEELMAADQNA